ncbi:retrovirus-related pol polyprotein from transposon TNT 1-94 [Tanacetum coccineum]
MGKNDVKSSKMLDLETKKKCLLTMSPKTIVDLGFLKIDLIMKHPQGRLKIKGSLTVDALGLGKLDFEDVLLRERKELKFNLFSVSQMCDKKNRVLLTETECLILFLDFKLIDESQVLLKVPRQNNRCDNGTEFKNSEMNQFCEMKGIKREFSVARTPQQNGVAERKNRTLIEAARTMLADSLLPTTFWAEAINTACYVQNRVLVTKPHNKTPYELLIGNKLLVMLMQVPSKGDDDDVGAEADLNNLETTMNVSPIPTTRIHKDHPKDQIIGDLNLAPQTRRMINFSKENAMVSYINKQRRTNHKDYQNCLFACFLSQNEPKKVWTLIDLPNGKRAIGTKWVFRNKKDKRGIVVKNKAIELVAQMDVKSAYLDGTIEEEVYVCQPLGFEDPQFPDKVYKVEKAVYGLHKAPRACVLRFQMSSRGESLHLRITVHRRRDWNLHQPKTSMLMDVDVHFPSMIGSLMYLTASRPDITFAVCACTRFQVTPKASHLHVVKRIFRYLKGQPKLGLWYSRDSPFDLEAFYDSDYAGASLDRKSITRGCQFLGRRLNVVITDEGKLSISEFDEEVDLP